jgi:hypothetical protein
MKNCLILGCARSGTSLSAGLLASSGYFLGDDLIGARASNPKGFFEDREVNSINEALLRAVTPGRPPILKWWVMRSRPRAGQRWLARVPVGAQIRCPPSLARRIVERMSHEPFCFKDPRLCYTLPAWRPLLPATVFVCVFRDPARTIASMLQECRTMPYLRDLRIDEAGAAEVWRLMYRHVLELHAREGEWLFLHSNQLLTHAGRERLGNFVGASVDHGFAEASLSRARGGACPDELRETYDELCRRAEYDLGPSQA